MAAEGRAHRRTHGDTATSHPFTDVVVGIAGQGQLNATGIPYAEALACGTGEMRLDRIGCHPLVTMQCGNGS
ncbi:hypothetical protein D3C80_1539740 [compost metagenome]